MHLIAKLIEYPDIAAAETVDGLFNVADEEALGADQVGICAS